MSFDHYIIATNFDFNILTKLPRDLSLQPLLSFNYIDILSSTDRLFRCITTHQCGKTREMLQAGVETRLILRQSDILQMQSHQQPQCKRRNFTHVFFQYIYIYIYITVTPRAYLQRSWRNGYHDRKVTRRLEFKTWMRLFTFHFAEGINWPIRSPATGR